MSDSNFDLNEFLKGRGTGGPRRPQIVRTGPPRRGRRGLAIVVIVALVLLFSSSSLIGLRVSYLFLDTLGHSNVFWTPVVAKLILFVIGALLTGGLVALNIPFWRRAAASLDRQAPGRVTLAALAVAGLAGLIGGIALASAWQDVLLLLHAPQFGQTDPVFGSDYSFFLFTLPVLDDLQAIAWAGALISLLGSVILAGLAAGIQLTPANLPFPLRPPLGRSAGEGLRAAIRHAGVALVAIFILASLGAHYGVYHLATDSHDGFVGLDATQRAVVRPVLGGLQLVALGFAIATVVVMVVRRRADPLRQAIGLGALLVIWLAVAGLAQSVPAAIYQATRVTPNAQTAQSPTISDFLTTSRTAWGLQDGRDVDVRRFGTPVAPTLQDLAADPLTLRNARLQDYRELPETFRQIDRSRAYQNYPTITVDRYPGSDGNTTEVMLGPREIAETDIPNPSFVNRALVYTHGYGITAASVNGAQPDGKPILLAGNAPLRTLSPTAPPGLSFPGGDPRIYCGQGTTQPVVVNTDQSEFDYPSGSGDHFSHGDQVDGIPAGGTVDRAALSLSAFGGTDLLLTNSVHDSSRVVLHRAITDRVQTLAPFLRIDGDPYIVLDEASHHLVWIVDAYVTSSRFPHAFQQADGTSYQRNAVKATVDARTCRTTLYSVDSNEPITAAYSQIFPGLLTPLDKMPMSLKRHLRYPEDLLQAQAQTYGQVHVRDPNVLFTRSDVWRIADETINDTTQPTQAYYVELTLPGDSKPSFVLLQTFSPARLASGGGTANNMTAWLAAQSDYTTTNHPKLVAVPLNNQNNVLGPLQFDNNLNSDPEVSRTKTLLGQGGSSVHFGNVIVLPFNNHSFLYVRPLYVLASSGGTGAFPLLRYVLVGTQNNVALGTSLTDALQKLFATQQPIPGLEGMGTGSALPTPSGSPAPGASPGASPAPGSVGIPPEARAVLDDLLAHQAAAQAALTAGDFAAFGREQAAIKTDSDRLRQLLGSSTASASAGAASPSPAAAAASASPYASP